MDILHLIEQRDHLLEAIERQHDEFCPANMVQVLELERIMETLDRLTTESSNLEDFCDASDDTYRWGAAFHHSR